MLARMQFGLTTLYHFFFVPLSIGLAFMVALMETRYVRGSDPVFKRMAQFWGRLFVINAAVGIVTGIVQEFQFGMNWSEYARFVADIFGAPLAVETLLAFFLESTFLGLWLFGWDRLGKRLHLACIWLVFGGSVMSAFWILVANSFMQKPVGYSLRNGQAQLTDFGALLTNSNLWAQFPHVLMAGLVTGAFFVLGVSAANLLRSRDAEEFGRSLRMALVVAAISAVLVAVAGDRQAKHVAQNQPMKLAAAEAVWETERGAGFVVIAIPDTTNHRNSFEIKIPYITSFLAYDDFNAEVKGLNQIQVEYSQKYGSGDYQPAVWITFFAFRGMVGSGVAMIGLAMLGLFLHFRKRLMRSRWYLRLLVAAIALPYAANFCGWALAEAGRQPWVVFGLFKTESAVSPGVSATEIIISLTLFALLYIALTVADVLLMAKYSIGKAALPASVEVETETESDVLVGAY